VSLRAIPVTLSFPCTGHIDLVRSLAPRAEFSQLLEDVRTRLLNFSLEIEIANPEAGEAAVGSHPIPEAAVRDAFHLTVLGDHNVVNSAGRDASQTVSFESDRWDQLRRSLADYGVPEVELEHLQRALEDDANHGLPTGAMGPATARWYGRLIGAAGRGAVSLSGEVAAGMIAAELLKFLGSA